MRRPVIGERLRTSAAVFREPRLRRLQLAWGGSNLGDWAQFVVLSIYAFEHGGAAAVGVFGLVRMGVAAAALPFAGMLADRYRRQRVLLGVSLLRAAMLAAIAATIAVDGPRGLVFALAALAAAAFAPIRPATMALAPLLARSSQELVASNVSASTMEALGTFVGPLVGGALAATAGFDVAVGVAAAIHLVCALLVAGIHTEGAVAVRPRSGRDALSDFLWGVRTLARERQPRLIVLLFGSQALVRGLLNVLVTVAALTVLGMGQSGVGWLNAALGGGGLVGGVLTVVLVGRRRLAGPFALALFLWGAPLSLIGLWPHAAWAFLCIGLIGVANALIDVSTYTILQRTIDEHVLGRVLGVLEVVAALSVAAGSALGAVEVTQLGIRGALVASGLLLPVLALLCYPRLRSIDDNSQVPERELAAVSALPLFAPLSATTLERLAFRLHEATFPAGATILEQGTEGERFYLTAAGEVDVILDGVQVARLGPGDYFGEIALLRNAARNATCLAHTDVQLYALDRESFVAAVSGDTRSLAAADELITARIEYNRAVTRAGGR